MESPVSVTWHSESVISFSTLVRSICGSVTNSMLSSFLMISMLLVMYFIGGNRAENSPVFGSVSM